MKKIGLIMSALFLIIMLTISGCGTSQPGKPAVSGQKPLKKLLVGYTPQAAVLTEIAQDQGYFKQEGVEVEFVEFTASTDAYAALSSGKIDVGVSFGTAGPLAVINNGADFVIIGGQLSGGHPVVARPETAAAIKSMQDYRGKTIATPRLYTPDVVWRGAMYDAGIDLNKDVTVLEMKSPVAVVEAVKSNKADIGIANNVVAAQAKAAGLAVIGWSNDFYTDHVCCRIIAKKDAVDKDPDSYRAFLSALIRAEKFRKEQPEQVVSSVQKFVKIDQEATKALVLEPHQIYSADPNRKGVIAMWEHMKHIGYAQEKVDVSKHINTDLYRQALTELQKKYPNDQFYTKELEERYKAQN
ncbi:MAG TPA: ABC transporter substrate-binding protein [Methylomusa anaerophila]|uniref:Putative aliphatic sulfonates-binding protein n=1 Tax=Methylomusa anaerophila TaxID=1930071 RepID=A0A348AHI6_9FIRM|nr:ABC transporter substrate-binding protein [Methylomusa anaerophila]BBB90534.1 putative aliphatic sulfonates-binding protein precursor [Methylomusa anaerophila]HML89826.1 ABC transporter substrate-binding protein [Methylomusa anaerophila]